MNTILRWVEKDVQQQQQSNQNTDEKVSKGGFFNQHWMWITSTGTTLLVLYILYKKWKGVPIPTADASIDSFLHWKRNNHLEISSKSNLIATPSALQQYRSRTYVGNEAAIPRWTQINSSPSDHIFRDQLFSTLHKKEAVLDKLFFQKNHQKLSSSSTMITMVEQLKRWLDIFIFRFPRVVRMWQLILDSLFQQLFLLWNVPQP